MTELSDSSREMFNFKSSSFTELFSRLQIAMLKIEDWIVIQRSKFDITVDGQPYPALQLYLNSRTGVHLTRVWGRTCLKGEIIPNSWAEIGDLCNQIFGQGLACCPGNMNNNLATEVGNLTSKSGEENLISVEYPFQRRMSIGCAVLHRPDGPVHDNPLVVCAECRSTVISEEKANKEPGEEVVAPESLYPEVKDEEMPDSKEAGLVANETHASNSLDESLSPPIARAPPVTLKANKPQINHWGANKPPLSYAALIGLVLDDLPDGRGTLNDLYRHLCENFPFFTKSKSAQWPNSIRHNLSLHPEFIRIKKDSGQGVLWTVNPGIDRATLIREKGEKATPLHIECSKCAMTFKCRTEVKSHITVVHKEVLNEPPSNLPFPDVKKEELLNQLSELRHAHGLNEDPKLSPFPFIDPLTTQKIQEKTVVNDFKIEFADESQATSALTDKGHQEIKLQMETKSNQYECEKCHRYFRGSFQLQQHQLVCNHGGNVSCDECDKEFTTERTLFLHKRGAHRGKKPCLTKEKYKCHLCKKTIKTARGLQYHIDWHRGNLNHKCLECEKTFEGRRDVNRHMLGTHKRELGTNESTYHIKCPECAKIFKSRTEVNKHTKTVHKKIFSNLEDVILKNYVKKKPNVNKKILLNQLNKLSQGLKKEPTQEQIPLIETLKTEPLNLEPFPFIDPHVGSSESLQPKIGKANAINCKKSLNNCIRNKGSSHPTYINMITNALETLKARNGSSRQALLKFIMTTYNVGNDKRQVNKYLKIALRNGIKRGIWRHMRESRVHGASGSFLLAPLPPLIEPEVKATGSTEEENGDMKCIEASSEKPKPQNNDEKIDTNIITPTTEETYGDCEADNDESEDYVGSLPDKRPYRKTEKWHQARNRVILKHVEKNIVANGSSSQPMLKASSPSNDPEINKIALKENMCYPKNDYDTETGCEALPSSMQAEKVAGDMSDPSTDGKENKIDAPNSMIEQPVSGSLDLEVKEKEMQVKEMYERLGVINAPVFSTRRGSQRKAKNIVNYAPLGRSRNSEFIRNKNEKPQTRQNIKVRSKIKNHIQNYLRNPNRLVGRKLRLPNSWRMEDRFKCELCEVSLSAKSRDSRDIARHYRRKHLWGNFYCSMCSFFAYYPREYASHMLETHSDMEGGVLALCTECNGEVPLKGNVDTLADHYKECVESWDYLAKEAKKKRAKERKEKEDLQERPVFICQICGKEYKRLISYRQHLRFHRLANSPQCSQTECGLKFKTLDEKKFHEDNAHQVPCEKCGKLYKNPRQLVQHDKQVHIEKVPCDRCGKMFKHKITLKEHIEIVHEQKPPKGKKCTECDLVFYDYKKMFNHRNIVHFPNKYQCKMCKRSFDTGRSLKKHELVHNGERNFSCDVCGKKLKRKEALQEHKMAHSGEKPYACQYCPYRGTSSSLLCHHKRQRHKGEYEEEKKEKERAKINISGGSQIGENELAGTTE